MSKKTKPELDDIERDDPADDAEAELDGDATDETTDGAAGARNGKSGTSRKSRAAGKSAKSEVADESDEDFEESETAEKPGASRSSSAKKARPTGKSKAAKSAPGGPKRPAAKSRGAGRRPVTPVKVASDKPWGTIALFGVVGLLFISIVGYTGYLAWYNNKSPQEQASLISGIVDYTKKDPKMLSRDHKAEDLTYPLKPPVGGDHNITWQNCMGDVYDAPIAEEHAVHSLEHGAIWITYQPDLPKDQVEALADKVRGKDFMMMSPYPGQDSPISLQAWGFQLKLDDANDSRIDDFIAALRTEGPEKGASCAGGVTVTGDKPREVAPPQGPGGGVPGAPAPAPGG